MSESKPLRAGACNEITSFELATARQSTFPIHLRNIRRKCWSAAALPYRYAHPDSSLRSAVRLIDPVNNVVSIDATYKPEDETGVGTLAEVRGTSDANKMLATMLRDLALSSPLHQNTSQGDVLGYRGAKRMMAEGLAQSLILHDFAAWSFTEPREFRGRSNIIICRCLHGT